MTLNYHITGWISVFFFTLSLAGISTQLRVIWRRKRATLSPGDRPTAILSLNQFFASYLAFYSFLVYGLCQQPFNHYLVWTRLPATLLVMSILYEIWHDRRTRLSLAVLIGSLLLLIVAVDVLVTTPILTAQSRWVSIALALFAASVFGQGIIHQIVLVRRSGRTGAISLRMHQLTTCKDLSTIAFALTMSFAEGWPLMLVGGVGVATKSVLMWHFRWARLSTQAEARRTHVNDNSQESQYVD